MKTSGKPLRQQLQKLVDVEKASGENLYVTHFTTNDTDPLKILCEWFDVSNGGKLTLSINPTTKEDVQVFLNGTTFVGVQSEVSNIITQINFRRGISPIISQNCSNIWDLVQPFDLKRLIRKIRSPGKEMEMLYSIRSKTKYICTLQFHFPSMLVCLHVVQN